MTDPEQDDVFDAYLKRRAVLPALDDGLEPPAALDDAVLAKARVAIQAGGGSRSAAGAATTDVADVAAADADRATGLHVDTAVPGPRRVGPIAGTDTSRAAGGPIFDQNAGRAAGGGLRDRAGGQPPNGVTKLPMGRPPRWAVPVALAATLLLCLSVVMNISLNTNRPSPNLQRAAAARADSKASALSNATAESNTAAGVDATGSGAVHDRFADNGERPQGVSGEIPSREVVLPQAKVAGVSPARAPVVVESVTPSAVASAPAAPAPADESSNAAGKVADAGAAAPSAASGAARLAADAPRTAADKAVMMAKRAGVAAPEYTPAPEASRAAADQAVALREAVVARANSAAAKPEAAVAAPVASQATEKSAPPAATAHPADPKVWLQQINALRAAGKAEQADAEMRRFKVAFPHYAIPAAAAVPAPPSQPSPPPH